MTTVLAIEDDPAILRGLTDNLRFEGYTVLTASDGETGYQLQRERKPDVPHALPNARQAGWVPHHRVGVRASSNPAA